MPAPKGRNDGPGGSIGAARSTGRTVYGHRACTSTKKRSDYQPRDASATDRSPPPHDKRLAYRPGARPLVRRSRHGYDRSKVRYHLTNWNDHAERQGREVEPWCRCDSAQRQWREKEDPAVEHRDRPRQDRRILVHTLQGRGSSARTRRVRGQQLKERRGRHRLYNRPKRGSV
jgi:hypothetical protein